MQTSNRVKASLECKCGRVQRNSRGAESLLPKRGEAAASAVAHKARDESRADKVADFLAIAGGVETRRLVRFVAPADTGPTSVIRLPGRGCFSRV